jgi:hypothetical protein
VAVSNEGVDRRRQGSPPRRDDDREGHYVFNLGENLTPRCPLLPLFQFVLLNFAVASITAVGL